MKKHCLLFINLSLISIISIIAQTPKAVELPKPEADKVWGLALHGGAGVITRETMTGEMEQQYTQKMNEALEIGYAILAKGGKALDAVEAVIKALEDSPLFNAGKGSVFTNKGTNEMDAAIMDGATLKAGAVASVKTIKNPIEGARAVMDKSEHVMLCADGADEFAKKVGLKTVDQKYFYDEKRFQSWKKAVEAEEKKSTKPKEEKGKKEEGSEEDIEVKEKKHGTVGCVALDKSGNLAAGTSTGGMTNKKFGRIGDAPIIGAGTYANNKTCAVSCTGHGEFFIRYMVAGTVSAKMEYGKKSLKESAFSTIYLDLEKVKGEGGLVAISKDGEIIMPFNTPGMYRAAKTNKSSKVIAIFKSKGDE
jgi:L-asparaginase / beta-aspartyl-peptidase